jgi:hypothetical protein
MERQNLTRVGYSLSQLQLKKDADLAFETLWGFLALRRWTITI